MAIINLIAITEEEESVFVMSGMTLTFFRQWAYKAGYDESAPRGALTLDRIDVNGNYCPENCRWANMKEQSNNRRCTPHYELDGEKHTLLEWAELTGIKYETIWARYNRGWDARRALQL